MTTKDTVKILAVLKVAYPRYFEKQDFEEKKQMADLWTVMLEGYPYEAVDAAVRAHISTNKFPPSVAEVIAEVRKLSAGGGENELEAWGHVSRAIRNSTYRAREEWEKLPEEIQQMVSPDLLRSWAMVSTGEAETVIQSQFLKTYRAAKKRQQEFEALPKSVQQFALSAKSQREGGILLLNEKLHDLP